MGEPSEEHFCQLFPVDTGALNNRERAQIWLPGQRSESRRGDRLAAEQGHRAELIVARSPQSRKRGVAKIWMLTMETNFAEEVRHVVEHFVARLGAGREAHSLIDGEELEPESGGCVH